MVITTTVFLVVYWMAHVYIDTLSTQFGGDERTFLPRLATAARHETGVLKGGVPAHRVYVSPTLLGETCRTRQRWRCTSRSAC